MIFEFPFNQNKDLQESYTNFDFTGMRFGLALKDMDSLVWHVAYRYICGNDDQNIDIWTLSIDWMTSY